MHILKVIHGYPPLYNAGSEVYSQSICNELSKNHRVSIFTRETDMFRPDFAIREEKVGSSVTKYIVNLPREKDGYRHYRLDSAFAELIKRIEPDIAHVGHLNHLSTGLVEELNQAKIPIVFTLHDFWLMCPRGQFLQTNFGEDDFYQLCSGQEDRKCATSCYKAYFSGRRDDYDRDVEYWSHWINSRMQETRSVSGKIDVFIAPSRYLQQRFLEDFGLPKDKVLFLDYGFPTSYLKPMPMKTPKFTFAYIGTHIPAKGVVLLIEAFSRLKGDCSLKIWGRNSGQGTQSLQELARSLSEKTASEIQWMGEYANHEIAEKVFATCDAIVVPSIWGENSPLVIHEAQACRKAVITANFGGMKEYVRDQVNGLLFEHRSVESLAEQMQLALDNPDLVKSLGEKGYLYSENGEVPSIENHCATLVEIYEQAIGGT